MVEGYVMVICGNILSLFIELIYCLGVLFRFVFLFFMMVERLL